MKKLLTIIITLIVGLVVGFFTGQEYTKYTLRKALEKSFASVTNTKTESKNPSESSGSTVIDEQNDLKKEMSAMKKIEKKVGDEIELKTMKFKVTDITETDTLQSSYSQPKVADEGTKFIVLSVAATNITSSSFPFTTHGWMLINSKGTIYEEYEDTIGNIENYINMQDLSPNIPKSGKMVFQVPKSDTGFSLNVSKAGSNDLYSIAIPTK